MLCLAPLPEKRAFIDIRLALPTNLRQERNFQNCVSWVIVLTEQQSDEDEIIDVDHFHMSSIDKMIHQGVIQDGKPISGFFAARQSAEKTTKPLTRIFSG